MTPEDFETIVDSVFQSCCELIERKNHDYASEEDPLSNFKRAAKLTGLSWREVWLVYFFKHYDVILSYLDGRTLKTEGIEGRIHDAINYLVLLAALIKEENRPLRLTEALIQRNTPKDEIHATESRPTSTEKTKDKIGHIPEWKGPQTRGSHTQPPKTPSSS